jgi:hypothetical protein
LSWVYITWFSSLVPLGAERSTLAWLKKTLGSRGVIYDVGEGPLREWQEVQVLPYHRSVTFSPELYLESSALRKLEVTHLLSQATLSIRGLWPLFQIWGEPPSADEVVEISPRHLMPGAIDMVTSAKKVTTNSVYMQKIIHQYFGRVAEIVPTITSVIAAPRGRIVLFSDSRVLKHSGLLNWLVKELPMVKFRVVNRGGPIPDLPNLEIIQPTESLFDLYKFVGLVICASQIPEGYGRVAQEALDSGRRVLVTPAGALPERVPPDCVIPASNSDAWISIVRDWSEKVQETGGFLAVSDKGVSLDPSSGIWLDVTVGDVVTEASYEEIYAENLLSKGIVSVISDVGKSLRAGGRLVFKGPVAGDDRLFQVAVEGSGLVFQNEVNKDQLFVKSGEHPEKVLILTPEGMPGIGGALTGLVSSFRNQIRVVEFSGALEELEGWDVQYPAIILEGWKPCYEALIEAWDDRLVAVHFHSTVGQSELGAPTELEFLSKVWDLLKKKPNLLLLHPGFQEARALHRLGLRCLWFPDLIDRSLQMEKKTGGGYVTLVAPPFPRKNFLVQLMACAIVGCPTELRLSGSSRFLPLYKSWASKLGRTIKVSEFSDKRSYLRLLNHASLGLQISFAEAFGYVAVDHFMVGTPCLVSEQVPGVVRAILESDMLKDWLVISDVSNIDDISTRITNFLRDDSFSKGVAEKVRDLLLQRDQEHFAVVNEILTGLLRGVKCQG